MMERGKCNIFKVWPPTKMNTRLTASGVPHDNQPQSVGTTSSGGTTATMMQVSESVGWFIDGVVMKETSHRCHRLYELQSVLQV